MTPALDWRKVQLFVTVPWRNNLDMRFRQQQEDLLDEQLGTALGKLLMAFQSLERAVKSALDLASAPSDALGIVELLTGDYTSNRRIEITKRIIRHVAALYSIREVEFAGRYPMMFGIGAPEEIDQAIAQAFSALTHWLTEGRRLLEYRNSLFHGEVTVEGGALKFIAMGTTLPSTADEIEDRRQEVLKTGFGLYMSANSFRGAVTYLIKSNAKINDRESTGEH